MLFRKPSANVLIASGPEDGVPGFTKTLFGLGQRRLLIDLGPDTMAASQLHRRPLTNVSYCLQTHSHADPLDLSHLLARSLEYGTIGAPCLHFYASPETLQRAAQTFERATAGYGLLSPEAEKHLNLKMRATNPFPSFAVGRYRVTAFPANHVPTMGASLTHNGLIIANFKIYIDLPVQDDLFHQAG